MFWDNSNECMREPHLSIPRSTDSHIIRHTTRNKTKTKQNKIESIEKHFRIKRKGVSQKRKILISPSQIVSSKMGKEKSADSIEIIIIMLGR